MLQQYTVTRKGLSDVQARLEGIRTQIATEEMQTLGVHYKEDIWWRFPSSWPVSGAAQITVAFRPWRTIVKETHSFKTLTYGTNFLISRDPLSLILFGLSRPQKRSLNIESYEASTLLPSNAKNGYATINKCRTCMQDDMRTSTSGACNVF